MRKSIVVAFAVVVAAFVIIGTSNVSIELQNHSFSALACATCEQIFLTIFSSLVCTLYVLDLYFVYWVGLSTSPRRQGSTFCPTWNSDKSGLGSKRLNPGRHCSTTPVVVDQWSSLGITQSWILRIMILFLTTITERWSTSFSLWLFVDYEINADSDTFIVNMVNAILPNHLVTWFCPKHHGFFFENKLWLWRLADSPLNLGRITATSDIFLTHLLHQ